MTELSMQQDRPMDWEILEILADYFDCEAQEVLRWLKDFNAEQALADYRVALGIAQ